jgi:hypothetical protein
VRRRNGGAAELRSSRELEDGAGSDGTQRRCGNWRMPSAASRLGGAGFVMDGQWAAMIDDDDACDCELAELGLGGVVVTGLSTTVIGSFDCRL